jgi:hypothetical protein
MPLGGLTVSIFSFSIFFLRRKVLHRRFTIH